MRRKLRKGWRRVALVVAILAGAVNAGACIESLAGGDYMHAAVAALFVLMQPTLYRIMVGDFA